MTDALKPCPFCGGEAELTRRGNDHTKSQAAIIKCSKFGCFGEQRVGTIHKPYEWAVSKVIEQWNTRAADTRIAELEAECKRLRKDAGRYLRLKNIANRWRGRMAAKVSITETCPEFGDRKEIQDLDRYLDLVEESER